MNCPLCLSPYLTVVALPEGREGLRCADCDLASLPPAHWMSPELERDRYLLHRNSREDADYVSFLNRLIAPVVSYVHRPAKILDFGSGPTAVLADLLREMNYAVALYDPYFADDESVLHIHFDAVVCCETAEHFRAPATEWGRMMNCLHPGGVLAVMTLLHDDVDIANWWYARDPTHVCFYSSRTMAWIAKQHRCEILQQDNRVTLLRKK